MKNKIIVNKNIILIFLFIFINQSYGYLINPDYTKLFGIAMNDISLLIDILIGIIIILKTKEMKVPKYEYKKIIGWFIAICIIGSLAAFIHFGQPFLVGFRAHRLIIVSMLLYFPVYKLLYFKIIKKEELIKALEAYTIFAVALYFVQFALSKYGIYFLRVYIGSRYGNDRFYFDPLLLDFMYIYELNEILSGKKIRMKSVLICIISILEILIVQNFRLTFLGLAFVTIIGILISKINKRTKIIFLTIILALGIAFFSISDTGRELVKTLFGNNSQPNSTMLVRHAGRDFYFDSIKDKMIFGMGYPNNSAFEPAKVITGAKYHYYLADNGIFGFIFMYGLFGLAWFVTLVIKLLKKGLKMFKNNSGFTYMLFAIFIAVICINEIHWYWNSGPFILGLVLLLSDYEFSNMTGRKSSK